MPLLNLLYHNNNITVLEITQQSKGIIKRLS